VSRQGQNIGGNPSQTWPENSKEIFHEIEQLICQLKNEIK